MSTRRTMALGGDRTDIHVYQEMTPPGGYGLEISYIRNKSGVVLRRLRNGSET